ncbi:MAG: alpha/beta hydrolase [Planctomycetes bacterium]|nr:alpha/beta hydrolase [Planctomycetota bacterium]
MGRQTANKQPREARRGPALVMRYLLKYVALAIAAFLVIVVLMMWFENLLVYPTWQIPPGDWKPDAFDYEEAEFTSSDQTRLHGWYFDHPRPRAHVLYCHGNGEDVSHLGDYMDELRARYEIAIFAFDYRGYGKSRGKPQEAGVIADGCAAHAWLAQRAGIPQERVVLWGRSIGGAVAVQLAVRNGARGLVLERTFANLPDVAARHYPWLPVKRLMRNRFDSLAVIGAYRGPLLQSHGTADEIVPHASGRALFARSASHTKKFVDLTDVSHNGPNTEEYYNELQRFIGDLP